MNFNPFDGRMATLPVFIFSSITRAGRYPRGSDRPGPGARRWC